MTPLVTPLVPLTVRQVRLTFGNHDYKTVCGRPFESYDRQGLSHALFASFLGPTALPFSARRVGRYNLLMLNCERNHRQ